MKISAWKKLLTIAGLLTLEIGHLTNQPVLIITGITTSIAGTILMFVIK